MNSPLSPREGNFCKIEKIKPNFEMAQGMQVKAPKFGLRGIWILLNVISFDFFGPGPTGEDVRRCY